MVFELNNFCKDNILRFYELFAGVDFREISYEIGTSMTMSKTSVYPAHRRSILDSYVVTKAVQQFEKLLKDEVRL